MDDLRDRPVLRLYVCGRPGIEYDRLTILDRDLPARQGRRFWVYLVINRRRPVSRDELATAIWGDDAPDTWDSVISAVASRLRRTLRPLGEAGLSIESGAGYYMLRLASTTFVDYERARGAIHLADAAIRDGDHRTALAEARVAMEIAARGFLPGEEAPWIQRERHVLAEIQARAMERTVAGEIGRGNADLAEQEARLLVTLEPLRESGYRLLMRAVQAGGNRAEAARIMANCRQVLREQADTVPSAETERLFTEIIRG